MIGTSAIRNLIRKDNIAQMYSAILIGQSVGMKTLDQCLTGLVQKGWLKGMKLPVRLRTRTRFRLRRYS
jgi:Tfp pilus assembly pilus retraction ATPase PilT